MQTRPVVPLWLMGLTNAGYGMYGGINAITVPQLLSARHVPEATIAALTAVTTSPAFWAFLLCPILDVRFSRRWYSAVTAVTSTALLTLALLNLDHLILAEALLLAGYLFANLWFGALGGWLSSITALERQGTLSVWVNVANIGAGGIMAVAAGELMQRLPPVWAALAIGAAVLLPIAVFPWMEAPGPDRRLARESFSQFFGELVKLVKRREVLVALALFVAPVASFSLTNFLGGLGNDFHASARLVGLVGGTGMLMGGICGCFIYPLIDRHLPLRQLYLAIGVVGATFTLCLVPLPHTPITFATALIGESIFQALAFTAATAITFAAIGPNNPLAATTYGFLGSAAAIPLAYMVLVDSAGYDWHGVAGGYAADAGLSLSACLLLGVSLILPARRQRMKPQRVS